MKTHYEKDYSHWLQLQITLLNSRRLEALDADNLIRELEGLQKSELHSLEGHLRVLLCHLLKYQYQPERRNHTWEVTIITQRNQTAMVLYDNPSFKHKLPDTLAKAYKKAASQAQKETGLPAKTFPASCSWTFEELMREDFWPDQAS